MAAGLNRSATGAVRAGLAAVALLATASLAMACGRGGGEGAPPSGVAATGAETTPDPRAGRFDAMMDGLCDARRRAAGDPAAARTVFYDRSHADLHTLARELETPDRPAAARLLEAKEAVEADFSAVPIPTRVGADLGQLEALARGALPAVGAKPRPCPRSPAP